MTREEYEILLRPETVRAIAGNRGRDSVEVALDGRLTHAREVASQVKYLARAESKLPSYAAAGCILPPRAFEQSSSEVCAALKPGSGDAALDLTCGLGVDTAAVARRFGRVVAVERDEVLADVARENFRRLGIANVEVVTADSAEYLRRALDEGRRFDWIYADPDRRDAAGRKMVCLEDCSPDLVPLLPEIRRSGQALCVKLSPMFDVDEAFRIFGPCEVETVSLGGECKEVNVHLRPDAVQSSVTAVAADSHGAVCRVSFPREDAAGELCREPFRAERYRWLGVPDAALQKARLVARTLAGRADVWSENGFAFAAEAVEGVPVRWFGIEAAEPYNPRRLRRELHGARVEILRRDFPLSTAEICRACGIREGGGMRAAFTRAGGEKLMIRLK
ncbi:MAG: methyltransferase domain-containing protein [Alistipes sp.]|nr:methyltransferase domain-containing protein [Alistipes sp.]